VLAYALIKNKKRKNQVGAGKGWTLHNFTLRFGLTTQQKEILEHMFKDRKKADLHRFFHDENYYNKITANDIKQRLKSGLEKVEAARLEGLYGEIRQMIKFTRHKPFSTHDLLSGTNIKIQIKGKGFFSGKIVHIDSQGVMIKLPHWQLSKKQFKKNTIVILFYWASRRDYEIHTKIRKLSRGDAPYLLLSHKANVFSGRHPGGMGIDTDIGVYFSHVFDLPEGEAVKTRVMQGKLVSLSIIGTEVVTRAATKIGAICMFEFKFGNQKKPYHFTGRVVDTQTGKTERRLFVSFIDMDEVCSTFIHKYVMRNL